MSLSRMKEGEFHVELQDAEQQLRVRRSTSVVKPKRDKGRRNVGRMSGILEGGGDWNSAGHDAPFAVDW